MENIKLNNSKLYENYVIFDKNQNMYPVYWSKCVSEYIQKPYNNYKNIVRDFQPLIILVNSVYNELETKTIDEILYGTMFLL